MRPTTTSYNSVIAYFMRCRDTPRALRLLEEMKNDAGLKPDVVTCNTLIGELSAIATATTTFSSSFLTPLLIPSSTTQ